jgi:hypothetical protein
MVFGWIGNDGNPSYQGYRDIVANRSGHGVLW